MNRPWATVRNGASGDAVSGLVPEQARCLRGRMDGRHTFKQLVLTARGDARLAALDDFRN
jgi:hypothetical protein